MNKTRLIPLILLLALLPLKGVSQSTDAPLPYYFFSQFQVRNGLPSNSVYCCVQDGYGFVWIGTGNGVCRYDGYHFTTVYKTEGYRAMGGSVEALYVDGEGLLWFATASGRGCYDPVSGTVTEVGIGVDTPISGITQDSEGRIWFCSADLFRYDRNTGDLKKYPSGRYSFTSAAADSEGQLWCTTSDGRLLAYDRIVDGFREEEISGLKFISPASDRQLLAHSVNGRVLMLDPYRGASEVIFNAPAVSSLLERVPGEFWIGTPSGIYICSEDREGVIHVNHSDKEPMSLSSNDIRCLATDREGNVWAGTGYDGFNLWRNNGNAYSFFYPINRSQSISGTVFRAVTVSGSRVWAGTEDGSLNYLTAGEPYFHQIKLPGEHNDYHDILPVGDELWVSTDGNGIFRLDVRTSSVIHHYKFSINDFHNMIRTNEGDILVGSTDGVFRYERESDSFTPVNGTEGMDVIDLCEDSKGRIWLGTFGGGITLLDSSYAAITVLEPKIRVTSLMEDSRHRIWVTTDGDGALVIDTESLSLYRLAKENGFSPSVTCSVVEDDEGMIWMSTDNGLVLIDPSDYRIVSTFFMNGENQSMKFIYGAVSPSSTGTVFMGTTSGLLSFTPSKMKSLETDRSIYISSIKGIVGDKVTNLSEDGFSALHTTRIVTSYKDAMSLRIRYSCQNFASPASYQYKYTLSSRNSSVSEVTAERMALFFNVGYGRHVFTVSLVGSDAPESTKSVVIMIRRPFYRSILAIIMMILVLMSLLSALIFNVIRWRRREDMLRRERIEKEKQKELYESKNAFFMNITHEIRTPLSLIKMPIDHMIRTGEYSKKDLLVIQANTDRLLNLINQLLDIRKFEQNEEKLEFTRYDLCEIVRRTAGLFNTMAEDQSFQLNVSLPEGRLEAMCARDSIEKIISNLITNALKYGKDRIDVTLSETVDPASEGRASAVLRVDSNGDPIPERDREKIFGKFVHGGKGTGLGLPLARALAEQHEGRLYLDIERRNESPSLAKVNSFVFELPLEHPDIISLETNAASQSVDMEQTHNDSRRNVLVVEDNEDFRLYLAESLSKEFNVFTAANGKAAIEKLGDRKVDLIISDVMMPVMDGCELCNYVKTTIEYSHIPVILLTAAVGMETRIETLEVGADGYIEKPFPIELLQATITNLFKNREIAYHKFSRSPLTDFNGAPTNKVDEDFMSRLHDVMLERIADSTLGINDLSAAMNTSTSTLFRKIKANTGLNINEYIRLSRLKRAAELLATGNYRVNEVADMVGFSSSSYFSSIFQKQFNMSPSAFMKKLDSQETGS